MYLQDHLILISSEGPKEEELVISQVSPVVEEVEVEQDVDLDMDEVTEEDLDRYEVKEEYLDMDEVEAEEAEEAVEATVFALTVVVEAVEEESIKILKTTMEGRITIMELINQILRETLHLKKSQLLFKLMYGMLFVLNEEQSEGGSIIMMKVILQQK